MPERRIALVHDWLTGMRGGEKVLESLCRMFPDAELLTLVHARGSVSPAIENRRIRTSVVQWLPRPARWYRHYLPLFPAAVELFDLDGIDLVISSSHCAVKSVVAPGRALHICYCHSPMRYAWDQFESYFGVARVGRTANRILRPVLAGLARWDRATASRVDHYVANSRFVAGRIARYYNRRAEVVHPPVDTGFFSPGGGAPEPYFLVVSALVPYKRIDIAIDAASAIDVPLKIVGTGPDRDRLQSIAGPTVEFAGQVSDDALRAAYRQAQAVVLPAEEDFGIVPVEAMACGRPVVALAKGGARETVDPGVTGVLVPEQTAAAFASAMDQVRHMAFDPALLHARAQAYSVDRFESRFREVVDVALREHSPTEC
jgi:glycosyltransferase involved in cell wall biosynthesis